ncbi:MAG TPA: SDR family NAD(P)-dependent oxidoreductase, partial [Solirubrobacteraceae bacterium]|nr:SDR family NAD(P)-dependent oxidoreductase [Solirubrobacteraceae bacterium]
LVLSGRREGELEAIAVETGGRPLVCDLAEPAAPEELMRQAGPVDILIANAALPASGHIATFTVTDIDRALMVNLRAPMVLGRLAGEAMAARGSGHLVFMSSMAGKVASTGGSVYSATKFGLRGFALGLREDLAPAGVGVSCVFPGFVRDAGMFADAGVSSALPFYVGTSTSAQVVESVVRAIEDDRAEVDVAPLGVRVGALAATVAPSLAGRVQRRLGADAVSDALAEAQRDMR